MENLTIVLYSTLTVPAIYGGAVETLLESFIEQNEISRRLEITLIAHKVEHIDRLVKERKYKCTKFRYINWPTIVIRANSVLISKTGMDWIPDAWDELLIREIKSAGNKKVLIEGGARFLIKLAKRCPELELFHHLHADIRPCRNAQELKQYDRVKKICVSDYIKSCQTESGTDNSSVFTVVNGINIERFNFDKIESTREEICRKFGLDSKKRYILFKGRLIKEKGVIELVRAFKRLKFEDTVLLLCGARNFAEKRRLLSDYEKELFQEIGNYKNIVATGHIPYEEIPLFHKISELCVVPSIWQEPCGLVVIEAIVSGVPLICTNTGGPRQLCANTEAIMIDVNERFEENLEKSMGHLLDSEAEKESISKSELRKREYFRIERYYDDMVGILGK